MSPPPELPRRSVIAGALALAWATTARGDDRAADLRWIAEAEHQRQRALGWGDQPYGAVLVLDGRLAGEGPSRVVQRNDPDAHAERVAIADAQRRLGRTDLAGATLYSTSRPCGLCEAAAARAGVARMVWGAQAHDAGTPRRS
jgi:tRNA(Arg) A34 adenosine deaminase TadA